MRQYLEASIWFCVTARTGVGHLRRCASVAHCIRAIRPDVTLGLLCNAVPAGLQENELALFNDIQIVERQSMANALRTLRPLVVVADTICIPELEQVEARRVLLLREVPHDRITSYQLPGGKSWDLLLVPNPPDHWMPSASSLPNNALHAVGWIYRDLKDSADAETTLAPVILICAGGGGTATTREYLRRELTPALELARSLCKQAFDIVQVLGPRSPPESRLEVTDRVLDPGGSLHQWLNRADVIVSTAGYNTVLELAQTDVPSLLVGIDRNIDDQYYRARQWGPKVGLAHEPGKSMRSGIWLAEQINRGHRRAPVSLGPSGAHRAAELIVAQCEQ